MIWHNHCAAEVAAELQSDLEKGLTAERAAERLAIYGKNRLTDQKKRTFLQRFAAQMKDFMVIILLIAAVLSNLLKYAGVQAFLSGVRPCVVALILATALTMGLSTLFSFTTIRSVPEVDLRGVVILLLLIILHFGYKHFKKKAPSPILMIVLSAGLGILFYAF